ncbi:MAG: ABC transporter substrate-binding protein [Rhodospirillaceae bacterium]
MTRQPARLVLFLAAACVAGAAIVAVARPAFAKDATAEAGPLSVVDAFHDRLIGAMKRSNELSARARYDRLSDDIRKAFCTGLTAKQAAGRTAWKAASEAERNSYLETFTRWTVASYASQFKGYSGHAFSPGAEKPGPRAGSALVESELTAPGDPPVNFTYLLIRDQGSWGIYDVIVRRGTTAISQLAKYISEFKSMARDGLPALTRVLTEKTNALLTE